MPPKQRKAKKKSAKAQTQKGAMFERLLYIIYWVIAVVAVIVAAGLVGYFIGYDEAKKESMMLTKHQQIQSKPKESKIESVKAKADTRLTMFTPTAKHEYTKLPKEPIQERPQKSTTDPQLVIIFDDVAFSRDIKAISTLDLEVTLSFLPPTSHHPSSAKLAGKQAYYMVHLPMEAMKFNAPEKFTLMVDDSRERISERIKEVKKYFPKVAYINNHTGSKFTSDFEAMKRLISVLKKEDIGFIDSRTIASTKAKEVTALYGMPFLTRDIFLDHEDDVDAIKKQIAKAVAKAKKYGHCIAICHPHKATIEALHASKELLKEVSLVRIDRLNF